MTLIDKKLYGDAGRWASPKIIFKSDVEAGIPLAPPCSLSPPASHGLCLDWTTYFRKTHRSHTSPRGDAFPRVTAAYRL